MSESTIAVAGHGRKLSLMLGVALLAGLPRGAWAFDFIPGDLVLSVYGDGATGDTTVYTDNQASPITLQEVTPAVVPVGQLVLPQAASGNNSAISGEYGSSSEGSLQLSADGHYLTIAGYGVTANGPTGFNADPQGFGGGTKTCIGATCYPLGQTASVANTPGSKNSGVATATVVPRVVALVGTNGSVDTSTALTGVFNENNPRSVATVNGSSFYISGQGTDGDTTAGLFLAQKGASTATAINTTYDTRSVQISNNTLYVSQDSTAGSGQLAFVARVGTAGTLPTGPTTIVTSASSNTILPGIVTGSKKSNDPNKINLSAGQGNTVNLSSGQIFLSPENYFFANATTLYIADGGNPKGDNSGTVGSPGVGAGGQQGLSNGGLQKWTFNGTTWVLDYTLSAGLHLVSDTASAGTTGLIGLTGVVDGDNVELFATNATIGDLDPTFLYGIDDSLSALTLPVSEQFTPLVTAGLNENIRGVAFAPVPEPASLSLLSMGLLGILAARRRRSPANG